MRIITTMLGPAMLCAALIASLGPAASAQYGSDDPRFERDPRDQDRDPRDETDPRDADVRDWEAQLIETLSVHELFDTLYENDDRSALATAVGDYNWDLLEYLDKLCDRWHTLVEGGALDDPVRRLEADALRERCLDIAQLGDQIAGETTFLLYVERQFAWDEDERLTFREGQDEFALALQWVDQVFGPDDEDSEPADAGRSFGPDDLFESDDLVEPDDLFDPTDLDQDLDAANLEQALAPLQRALDAARSVGDTWRVTRALTLAAQIHKANGDLETAAGMMIEGLRLGRQIHDLDTVWTALSMRYEAALEQSLWEQALATLGAQYELAVELADDESAERIMARLVRLDGWVSTVGN